MKSFADDFAAVSRARARAIRENAIPRGLSRESSTNLRGRENLGARSSRSAPGIRFRERSDPADAKNADGGPRSLFNGAEGS